jgi:hypothetical protein
VAIVVELPAAAGGKFAVLPGHAMEVRDCFSCGRDFRVYVPLGGRYGVTITYGVPCPHCRRYEAEVIVSPGAGAILVQAPLRTWVQWRVRSTVRAIQLTRRSLAIWLSGLVRRGARVGSALRGTSASAVSVRQKRDKRHEPR